MINGARVLGDGRAQNFTDDQSVLDLAKRLVYEDKRRSRNDPEYRNAENARVQKALAERGLDMTESDMKSQSQMIRDEGEVWGYNDFENYARGQQGDTKPSADGRSPYELRQGDEASVMSVEDQRERGMYIRDPKTGERKWLQGGQLFNTPEQAPRRTITGVRGATNDELRRLKEQDSASGQSARIENERMVRGQLTEREMQEKARLLAGRGGAEPIKSSVSKVIPSDYPRPEQPVGTRSYTNAQGMKETFPLPQPSAKDWYREPPADMADKVEFDIRRQAQIRTHAGVEPRVTPEDSQAAILEQLRARKARGGEVNDRRARENSLIALIDASNERHSPSRYFPEGGNIRAQENVESIPTIGNLGHAKYDSDVTIARGNEVLPLAVRRYGTGGAGDYYHADPRTGDFLGNYDAESRQAQIAAPSETLNAPTGAETAETFVNRNIYENYGAQFFGDDSIIASMDQKGGSGGGIPQVGITQELAALEEAVFQKTGQRRGIRSVASLQAATEAVIAAGNAKGIKWTDLVQENGQTTKKSTSTPGIREVMVNLDIPPAQQSAIANALFQVESARRQNVDLDSKERYMRGGPGRTPWGATALITGLDDPQSGGDRLPIAKDQGFATKARKQLNDTVEGAAHPFVGLNQDDVDARKAYVAQYKKDNGKLPQRRPEENLQVFKGMDATQARKFYQNQVDANNAKGSAKAKKSGKTFRPASVDVQKVRASQEGNIISRFREQQREAQAYAQPRARNGVITPGIPVPENLQGTLQQRPAIATTAPTPSGQSLLPKPVRPASAGPQVVRKERPMDSRGFGGQTAVEVEINLPSQMMRQKQIENVKSTIQDAGKSFMDQGRNVAKRMNEYATNPNFEMGNVRETVESAGRSFMDQGRNAAKRVGEFATEPRYQRGRRIGYGAASAAVLGSILGIGRSDEEDRREQY